MQVHERMSELINSQKYILYFESSDKENKNLKWKCYGDYERNTLILELSDGRKKFYGEVESPVKYPAMVDRRFGIDVSDQTVVDQLSNDMWDKVKDLFKE